MKFLTPFFRLTSKFIPLSIEDGEGCPPKADGVRIVLCIWLCLFSTLAFAQTTFDPLSLSIGARALGMGSACTAMAEESDTLFTNPAGLGEIDTFNLTSMSGKLLEEVNYAVLGCVYPLGQKSAIGVGYVNATVAGIELRDSYGTLQQRSNFANTAFLISFGRKYSEEVSLGANIKYYAQDGQADNDGDGTALNMDVGFLRKGPNWLSVGAVAQNIIGHAKMDFNNGEKEQLPRTLKLGSRLYLLGHRFEAARYASVEVIANIDAHLDLSGSIPTTLKAGLEFMPDDYLILRAGIDQNPKGRDMEYNYTLGLSVRYAGIGFHYAYHTFTEFSNNATSFFSLTFDERGWPFEGVPDIFMGKAAEAS